MSDMKISDLSAAAALDGSELIELVQAASNVKLSLDDLAAFLNAGDFMRLTSDYTLTSTTATQKLFNVGSSGLGTITLPTGLYFVKTMLYLTSMSGTSGNGTFDIKGAGTATIGNSMRHAVGIDATAPTTAATQTGSFSLNTTTNNLVTNATGTAMGVEITGILDVTGAGTIIPSIALTTAAAASVRAPSFISVQRLAPTGTTYQGAVS